MTDRMVVTNFKPGPQDCPCERTCSVEGCERPRSSKSAKGLCVMHYRRWRAHGDVGGLDLIRANGVAAPLRFFAKVKQGQPPLFNPALGPCWIWQAGTTGENSYGRFHVDAAAGMVTAHRYAYELLVGPIPEGLQLDHLCRVPRCVNPAHLEPVTNAENQRRGFGPPGLHARATHCKRGHEFTPENTYRRPSKGNVRECLICLRARNRRDKAKSRGA